MTTPMNNRLYRWIETATFALLPPTCWAMGILIFMTEAQHRALDAWLRSFFQ